MPSSNIKGFRLPDTLGADLTTAQGLQDSLADVDVWDILSLDPRHTSATNVDFVVARIRQLSMIFHPDKRAAALKKLKSFVLPGDGQDWHLHLIDLRDLLRLDSTVGSQILAYLQDAVAKNPARWVSTWNFEAIDVPGADPFAPIPSWVRPDGPITRKRSASPGDGAAGAAGGPRKKPKTYDPATAGFENLIKPGKRKGGKAINPIAVAVVPQPCRPEQDYGAALWVVVAYTTPSSRKVKYHALNVNVRGEDLGQWNWKTTSKTSAVTEAFICKHGRWLGAFGRWGGLPYVERFFTYRASNRGANPLEDDSLGDNVGSNSP